MDSSESGAGPILSSSRVEKIWAIAWPSCPRVIIDSISAVGVQRRPDWVRSGPDGHGGDLNLD